MARTYLAHGQAALADGNTDAAVEWYHRALATNETFDEAEYSPQALAFALTKQGVPAELLMPRSPTSAMVENPNVSATTAKLVNPAATESLAKTLPRIMDPPADARPLPDEIVDADSITSSRLLERGAMINTAVPREPDANAAAQRTEVLRLLAESQLCSTVIV